MVISPTCDAPVAEDNIKLVDSVIVVEVILAKGARTDDSVLFLGLVLLRNRRINEVAGFNKSIVPDFNKYIARLDI